MGEKLTRHGYAIRVCVGLLLMSGLMLVPPAPPLTSLGMRVLGVFVGTIWLYSTCGIAWPSLLALVAIGACGAYESVDVAASAFLGQSTVVQTILMTMICEGMRRSKATQKVAFMLLSSQRLVGHPMLFSGALLLIFYALGAFMSVIPAVVVAFMVFGDTARSIGCKPGDRYHDAMITALFLAAFLGSTVFPQRGVYGMMWSTYAQLAAEANLGLYMAFDIVIGVVFVCCMTLVIRFLPGCDFSKLQDVDAKEMVRRHGGAFSLQQKAYIAALALMAIWSLLGVAMPQVGAFSEFWSEVGVTGIMCIAAAALAVVRVEGKPLMDISVCLRDGVPWSVVLAVGAMMCITSTFSSPDTGILEFLSSCVGSALSNLGAVPFVLVTILITLLATGFMSNLAICIAMLGVALPLAPTAGVSTAVLGVAIVVSSCMGALSPGGSGPAPLLYGYKGLTFKAIYRSLLPYLAIFAMLMTCATLMVNLLA